MKVQDLILTEPLDAKSKAKTTNKTVYTYTVEEDLFPDIVITRKTTKTETRLVLLVTQNQYYIQSVKPAKDPEPLDATKFSTFFNGLESGCINAGWLKGICRGRKKRAEALFHRVLGIGRARQLICQNLVTLEYDSLNRDLSGCPDKVKEAIGYCLISRHYSFGKADSIVRNTYAWAEQGILSKNGVRKFVEIYWANPLLTDAPQSYHFRRLESLDIQFNEQKFVDYITYRCVREGFGDNLSTWLCSWHDCLSLQKQLYGKVREKYPENLLSYERKLSFECQLRKNVINAEHFSVRYDELGEHIYKDDMYLITPPHSAEEMIEEARQQANCLASYVQLHADGKTDIYFMRKVKESDKSFVTVEVRDGHLQQAYLAYNKRPTSAVLLWLEKWCAKQGFICDVYQSRTA